MTAYTQGRSTRVRSSMQAWRSMRVVVDAEIVLDAGVDGGGEVDAGGVIGVWLQDSPYSDNLPARVDETRSGH